MSDSNGKNTTAPAGRDEPARDFFATVERMGNAELAQFLSLGMEQLSTKEHDEGEAPVNGRAVALRLVTTTR